MARGKNSAALFEKIKLDRPIDRQARPGIVRSLSRMFAAGGNGSGNGSPRPVMAMTSTASPSPAPVKIDLPAGGGSSAAPAERRSAGPSSRGELQFRMSYTGAIIAGFAGVTVVAAAFLAGQRMPAIAARPSLSQMSIDQLRAQPAQPGVINVSRNVPPPADLQDRNDPAASPGANRPAAPPPAAASQRPKARQAILNYVIIQSYPAEEEKMAREAVKLLNDNGIECTLEKGMPGYTSSWYSVVGLDGFNKVLNNPQLDAYTRKVKQVSDRNAKKGSFKAFAPTPVRWGGRNAG